MAWRASRKRVLGMRLGPLGVCMPSRKRRSSDMSDLVTGSSIGTGGATLHLELVGLAMGSLQPGLLAHALDGEKPVYQVGKEPTRGRASRASHRWPSA